MKSDTKNKWLHIRITSDEHRVIQAISSLAGYNVSEWVRKLIQAKIKKYIKK